MSQQQQQQQQQQQEKAARAEALNRIELALSKTRGDSNGAQPTEVYAQQLVKGITLDATSSPPTAVFKYHIGPNDLNLNGTLHGGAIATLLNTCSKVAVKMSTVFAPAGAQNKGKPAVDVDRVGDSSFSYVSAGDPDSDILITVEVAKVSRNLAFTKGEIRQAADGRLVAFSTHCILFKPAQDAVPQSKL
ncbi:hypothetical protein GQ42DRAFT_161560 [Ramicandelaber brevisporus]|nr:hypothetical protein GQ42DRAFT_161560 [Ramicandelaber brevisporus]